MFDLGPEKLFIVLAAIFIFLGPKEIPAAARKIGEMMRYLRSLQDTLQSQVNGMMETPQNVTPEVMETDDERDHLLAPQLEPDEPDFAGPSSFA